LLDQSQKRLNTASPSLQIFTLRTPYLNVAGKFRQFSPRGGASKSPELLAYLLIEGRERGCRSDQVSAAIWPDLPPEKATVSFHQALYRLRQTIFQTPDYVVVRDGYYRVNPEYLDWCDALAFDDLYRRVANAPVEKRLDLQLELLALNRGEFLARIELGEWGMARRRSYERQFLETVSLAGQQLLKAGEAHQTLAIVHEGLARNFFREDLHRLVLQAYAELGLHEDVKRHYFHLRDMLQQELGISPDRRTTHLFQILTASRYPIRT
jgi:two-component SAPR family response regulator